MSPPPSVALELNGIPLVVRKTFIDCDEPEPEVHEVPRFVKLNTAPAACRGSTMTADVPEPVVHDETLGQLRVRLLGNADACSCGDSVTHSHCDASDVASTLSMKAPSNVCSTKTFSSFDSYPNGLNPQSCSGYLPRQDCSALDSFSHPLGIQSWISCLGIAGGEEQGDRTTLLIRNIPECFTRCKLEELLNAEGFATRFDFLYLPADLKTRACFGYAFVNMVTPSDVSSFMERFQGFQWPVPSSKRAAVYVNEGLESIGDLIARYRNSPMMHPSVPYALRPAIYCNGCETPFPEPTAPVKPPRTKTRKRVPRQ